MQMKNLCNPIFTAIVFLNKPKNYEQLIPNQPYCKSEGLFRFLTCKFEPNKKLRNKRKAVSLQNIT